MVDRVGKITDTFHALGRAAEQLGREPDREPQIHQVRDFDDARRRAQHVVVAEDAARFENTPEFGKKFFQIFDLEIKIGPKAEAGIYHAKISFFEGSTREEAEARKQGPSTLINLEISDNSQEGARLKKFSAERPIFFKMPVAFSFRLENEENKPLPLDGRVMIYNRRGEEVAVLPINKEGGVASWEGPEQKLLLANLGETGGGFGRYKAILRLSYGAKRTLIQDTVFFWVIPWPIAVVFILILTALIGSIVYAFYKLYNQRSYDQIE